MNRRRAVATCLVLLSLLLTTSAAFGQANGKLQLHFMNVGQGDGAVLISPARRVGHTTPHRAWPVVTRHR